MLENARVSVVVPAYCEETQIEQVIVSMPSFVDHVIVVDDASPDRTAEIVRGLMPAHPSVELIVLEKNAGVGAAIVRGYERSLELGVDVAAVMAGDGQMPPDELADICRPVIRGDAEYSKANRLVWGDSWTTIPRKRFVGNAMLTVLTKIASGYWQITDSQTGFTAISAAALRGIDLKAMYPRYGYPNDMLVRLNVVRARVIDVPSRPVYGVGEQSKLKIGTVMPRMAMLLLKRFLWRMWSLYCVRDFHPLVVFFALGSFLLSVGMAAGVGLSIWAAIGNAPSGPTAVLVALAVQMGGLLLLFSMWFDFEHNRHLNDSVHVDRFDRVPPRRFDIDQARADEASRSSVEDSARSNR